MIEEEFYNKNLQDQESLKIYHHYYNAQVLCTLDNLIYDRFGMAGNMLMLNRDGSKDFISPQPMFCKPVLKDLIDLTYEEKEEVLTHLGYGIKNGCILNVHDYHFEVDTGNDYHQKDYFWMPRPALDYLRSKDYDVDGHIKNGIAVKKDSTI